MNWEVFWCAVRNFEPHHIFYETKYDEYVKYDKPLKLGFGFEDDGYMRTHREYTRMGEWFRTKPFILYFLVGLVYYPPAWIIWFVVGFIVGIFDLLFMKWDK